MRIPTLTKAIALCAAGILPNSPALAQSEPLSAPDSNGDPCWVISNVRGADVDRSNVGQSRVGKFNLKCFSETGSLIVQETETYAVCRQDADGLWRFQGAWVKRTPLRVIIMDLPENAGCVYEYED
ncbi:MAG: hypothetical protein Alpg2KO_02230 [Alphaproteobacteria bacterium]